MMYSTHQTFYRVLQNHRDGTCQIIALTRSTIINWGENYKTLLESAVKVCVMYSSYVSISSRTVARCCVECQL